MPRGISWSFNETEALIRLWADSTTQTALRLNSRNRCIYEDIANQLQAIGITRTADQCQMRIKLLKKMYRQTNEAIKRGDVFQQRPCPFYNEIHRIFSGTEDLNGSSLLSNSQSLLTDDVKEEEEEEEEEIDDDIDDEIKNRKQENENHIQLEDSTKDKLIQAIDRLIQYQKQNEARWYKYLEQQASLELQRRQEDRAYQLQLIQLLTNVISTKTNSSPFHPVLQQLLMNNNSQIEKVLPQHDNNTNRGEKRKSSLISSDDEKNPKIRQSLPSNFYSLLAQIHNINNMDDSS
ncbi:unnamed protein product [Rotaria sp. Silwood2]|nr:unnamed protein product [Rotaria sp. Silwood2]CAF2701120.1 unnamed protein product [Rotaria sp. Silwood2]CAF3165984.1 unnamed protein product [Rotaria sp. Silwood2]CAF3965054.1 unnamed protein product [Rotaria sp. Silwood2]CAF4202593.1 unnamed protein product [Rotaria sp. Silwood2]